MLCPRCGNDVTSGELPGGGTAFHCETCGWGRQAFEAARVGGEGGEGSEPAAPLTMGVFARLLGMWIISAAIVLGPYYGIIHGGPLLASSITGGLAEVSSARIAEGLTPGYWIAMAIYLALGLVFTPKVDMTNLGWFGGMVDNPFSYEDNWNRTLFTFAILLFPAKVVCATLGGTWRLGRRIVTGK